MNKFIVIILVFLMLTSCVALFQVAEQLSTTNTTLPISNAENIMGLKSSLDLGIEKAVGFLGVENGFYKDAVLKLLLPPEAQPIIDNVRLIPGGNDLINKAILSINRSAEDAVKEATPIFKNAIRNMTFSDAMSILFGAENAATEYLRKNTYIDLKAAFAPKVDASLTKPLLANISTKESWNLLSSGYNTVSNSPVGLILGLKPVTVNLQEYVTEKALDALFLKVAEEEKAIRTNPIARVSDILKRVFGQIDKK